MAQTVIIAGTPGSGKTTSVRNLNPETTFYINADRKGGALPWKGSALQYNAEKKNYLFPSDSNAIDKISNAIRIIGGMPPTLELLNKDSFKDPSKKFTPQQLYDAKIKEMSRFDTIIIDSMNGIMTDTEMISIRANRQKGGDVRSQWRDLGEDIYALISLCNDLPRPELIVYMMFHIGERKIAGSIGAADAIAGVLTNGRKLEKIQPESKVSIVLFTEIEYGSEGKNEYYFQTQANYSTAKSPAGMFDFRIPNDLQAVSKQIREYYQ